MTRAQRSEAPRPTDVPEQDKLMPSCGSCWAFGAERRAIRQPSMFGQPWLKSMAPVWPVDESQEEAYVDDGSSSTPSGTSHGASFSDGRLIAPLEWADPEPEEILTATRRTKIYVAADTGAVDHVVHPKDLPASVRVIRPEKLRNFVGPKGETIDHWGESKIILEQKDGPNITNTFQVADVVRPLHSISRITDNEHDVIFTKKCGYVVPAGLFDELLAQVKHIAKYHRRGGLYVGEFDAVDPSGDYASAKPSGFAGPGASR